MVTMVGMCSAGAAFGLRFFMALQRERKRSWIGYWLRLPRSASEEVVMKPRQKKRPVARAA
jgi:hypothetical protein